VRPPIILATFAVIISFVPMFFITGMMGPYMAPMALNVPVAMLMSLLVAFTITPWLSYHMLLPIYHRPHGKKFVLEESALFRVYRAIIVPVFERRILRWGIVVGVMFLLAFAGWLVVAGFRAIRSKPAQGVCQDLLVATFLATLVLFAKAETTGDIPGNRELWCFCGLLLAAIVQRRRASRAAFGRYMRYR